MGLFPRGLWANAPVITPWSFESLGYITGRLGASGSINVVSSAVYPTASKAFYIPFVIVEKPFTVARIGVGNGTAVSGNIDAGVYDSQGNRLVSSGSTAQSGTSAVQWLDVTDTTLNPGLYYMALSVDNTTATVLRSAGLNQTEQRILGCFVETSAFALPATATFAVSDAAYLPALLISSRTA